MKMEHKPLEYLLKEKDKKIIELEKQLVQFSASRKIITHDYGTNHVKFGYVTDTHMGDIFEELNVLKDIYKKFKKEGCECVYHSGDLCDGENMYRGHAYDIHKHGADQQVDWVIKSYPNNNLTTYFITGNHDLSFWRNAGVDIGKLITERRKDMIYLGQEEADILIGGKDKIKMNLFHPGGGTAYALSYHPQKIVESFSGGKKPNILLIGHYHKAEFIPKVRNVAVIQGGTTCSQTPFMKRKKLEAHLGGWIIDLQINKKGIDRIKAEFIPYFE